MIYPPSHWDHSLGYRTQPQVSAHGVFPEILEVELLMTILSRLSILCDLAVEVLLAIEEAAKSSSEFPFITSYDSLGVPSIVFAFSWGRN